MDVQNCFFCYILHDQHQHTDSGNFKQFFQCVSIQINLTKSSFCPIMATVHLISISSVVLVSGVWIHYLRNHSLRGLVHQEAAPPLAISHRASTHNRVGGFDLMISSMIFLL